jgi:hypothetical protein
MGGLAAWAAQRQLYQQRDNKSSEDDDGIEAEVVEENIIRKEKKWECNHEAIELKAEENSKYCGKGSNLYGVQCHECQAAFVVKKALEKETAQKQFAPRVMHAGYSCRNVADCKYALCFGCYQKQLAAADGKGRKSRG